MPDRKHGNPKDKRPIVVDDFIYNDPDEGTSSGASSSETPDEALRALQYSRNSAPAGDTAPSGTSGEDSSAGDVFGRKNVSAQPWVSSSGIILDGQNRRPVDTKGRRPRKEHRGLRGFALTLVTVVLVLFIGAYIFHRIAPEISLLGKPEVLVSRIVSPVQSAFSRVTDSAVAFIRSWWMRDDLEDRYEEAVAENEQLTYKKMVADELKKDLGKHIDFIDEVRDIENLNPLTCKITGRSDTDYFCTFTIDKGSADGILRLMPVISGGSLVGYIDSVDRYRSVVRTVIDSNISIGVVIQSNTRDQGTLNGTIGMDGTAMCRVYLVEKSELPRPGDMVITSGIGMDFMDGIPIGVITESTRGSKDNTDFIVVKPNVDFSTLEHVTVLRYKTAGEEGQSVTYPDVTGEEPAEGEEPSDDEAIDEYDLSGDYSESDDIEMMDYSEYTGDYEEYSDEGEDGSDDVDVVTYIETVAEEDDAAFGAGPEGGDDGGDFEEEE